MAELKEPRHCKNCGAIVPKERKASPYCADSCKDADKKKG